MSGLYLQTFYAEWAAKLQGTDLPFTAAEAAVLSYRFAPDTVDDFIFHGIDDDGLADDLAVWRSTGLLSKLRGPR